MQTNVDHLFFLFVLQIKNIPAFHILCELLGTGKLILLSKLAINPQRALTSMSNSVLKSHPSVLQILILERAKNRILFPE